MKKRNVLSIDDLLNLERKTPSKNVRLVQGSQILGGANEMICDGVVCNDNSFNTNNLSNGCVHTDNWSANLDPNDSNIDMGENTGNDIP
ncbi:MAG: hypothetical protein ACNS60_09725 [Candidatus Cyclobacteriaceae bacterium M2_1C_046]